MSGPQLKEKPLEMQKHLVLSMATYLSLVMATLIPRARPAFWHARGHDFSSRADTVFPGIIAIYRNGRGITPFPTVICKVQMGCRVGRA